MIGGKRPMPEKHSMIEPDSMDNLELEDELNRGKDKSGTGSGGAQVTGFSMGDHDYLMAEHSLDSSSWMSLLAILIGWAVIAWAYPPFSLSYPIFFIPFAYLIYRSRTAQLVLVNNTIRNFTIAFAVAPLVLIVLTIFLLVVFPLFDQAGSLFFSLWMIIFLQVFGEELVKYRMIANKVEIDETASVEVRQMQYLDLSRCLFTAMALSLGYGTYQGLSVSLLLAYSSAGLITPIVISFVLAMLYIPSHCMSGYLIGLQLARKTVLHENIPAFFIIIWPVLFRSAFLFQFLYWAGTNQHPLIAWAITSAVLTSMFVFYTRHVKKKLPREYLDNAGYNVVLGYIPIVDDAV